MSEQSKDHDALTPAKAHPLRDPRVRAIFFQVLALAGVVLVGVYLIGNTLSNMETRGISTGFGFLSNEAGFGILQSLIPYDESYTFGRTFLVGLLNTVLVSALGIVLATILGFIIGIARLSDNWLIARLATIYIEIIRNIPLLLQIFFWYFAVLRALPLPRESIDIGGLVYINLRGIYMPWPVFAPAMMFVGIALLAGVIGAFALLKRAQRRQTQTGDRPAVLWPSIGLIIGLPALVFVGMGMPISWDTPALTGFNFSGGGVIIPELGALLVALTMYTAAFIAETVRAGIQSVGHGQVEAAHALGLRQGPTLRLVIIPQAMRVIVPPLTNQYLNLVKNSSLATAIGYPDLVSVFAGTTLNQTGQAVEVIAMTMAVYLTLSILISAFMNWYNQRVMLVER